jgi:hypothetical protein
MKSLKEYTLNESLKNKDFIKKIVKKNAIEYRVNDVLHNPNGPAIEYFDGSEEWYFNGKKHREGGPSATWGPGNHDWFYKGVDMKNEKSYNAAYSKDTNKWSEYAVNNKSIKKTDTDGTIRYYNVKGQLHRENGPAVEFRDGDEEYWFNGKQVDYMDDIDELVKKHKK